MYRKIVFSSVIYLRVLLQRMKKMHKIISTIFVVFPCLFICSLLNFISYICEDLESNRMKMSTSYFEATAIIKLMCTAGIFNGLFIFNLYTAVCSPICQLFINNTNHNRESIRQILSDIKVRSCDFKVETIIGFINISLAVHVRLAPVGTLCRRYYMWNDKNAGGHCCGFYCTRKVVRLPG